MHVISRTREQAHRRGAAARPADTGGTTRSIDRPRGPLRPAHAGRRPLRRPRPGAAPRPPGRTESSAGRRAAGQELIRFATARRTGSGAAVLEIVTDDMPYLVESVLAAVAPRRGRGPAGHPPHRRRASAPGRRAARRPARRRPGRAAARGASPSRGSTSTSAGRVPAGLEADVAEVLHDVREVVRDAPAMARQARALADRLLADGLLDADRSAGSSTVDPGRRRREPAALARRRALHVPRPPPPRRPTAAGSFPRGPGSACSATASTGSPKRSAPTSRPTPRPSCSCSPAPARRAACCGPCSPTTSPSASSTATGTAPG